MAGALSSDRFQAAESMLAMRKPAASSGGREGIFVSLRDIEIVSGKSLFFMIDRSSNGIPEPS